MQCEGNCNKHKGKVKAVIVKSNWQSPDPFINQELQYNYCENAIKKDKSNGYVIEIK